MTHTEDDIISDMQAYIGSINVNERKFLPIIISIKAYKDHECDIELLDVSGNRIMIFTFTIPESYYA